MPISPEDRDYMIRTVIGEASDQPDLGQAAVAHTIMNRTATGRWGDTPSKVVLARGQFEPWSTRAKELLRIKPDSKEYKRTSQIVDDVLEGRTPDPTQGSTHFLAPDIVRARRGGSLPDWASGQGIQIGGHTFYAPEGRVQSPIAPQPAALAFNGEDNPEAARLFDHLGIPLPPAQGAPRSAPGATVPASAPGAPATPAGGMTANDATPEAKRLFEHLGIPLGVAIPKTTPEEIKNPPEYPLGSALEEKAQKLARDPILGPGLTMRQGMPVAGPTLEAGGSAAAALVQPGDFGTNYAQNQAVSRRVPQIYAQEHPWMATGANALGAAGTYGPLAGTNAGRFAMGLPNRLGPSPGWQVYSGTAGGAGINALDAAMRGDDVGTGAVVGAGAGAAAPLISWGLKAGVPFVRNRLNMPFFRPPEGLRDINQVGRGWLVNDMLTGQGQRPGPLGFFGELNPAMTESLQSLSFRGGEPSYAVRSAYRARAKTMFNELEGDLDQAFGQRTNILERTKQLEEQRSKAVDPLYDQFRKTQIEPTPELKKLGKQLDEMGLWDTAEQHAALRDQPFTKKTKVIPPLDPNTGLITTGPRTKQYPSAESWDMVKRTIDDKINAAYKAGNNTEAASWGAMKKRLIAEIGKTPAGPIWEEARSKFSDSKNIQQQLEAGRDAFLGGRSKLSVNEFREELKDLSAPELHARLEATRDAISEALGDTTRGASTMRDKLLAPNAQQKLHILLDPIDPGRADTLIQRLQEKALLAEKHAIVMGGSQTTSNTQAVKKLDTPPVEPWNFNVGAPATYLPPSIRNEMLPSSLWAARREQSHATARNALAEKLLVPAESQKAKDLNSAIFEEARARVRAQQRGERWGNAANALVVAPSAETFRLRAYEPKERNALAGP